MIYKLSTYRRSVLPQIKYWCEAKGGDPKSHVSDLALATSAPILVVATFIGELYGFTEPLKTSINNLEAFYKAKVEE